MQGRWQILQQTPLVIADAAHNPHGLEIAMQQLAQLAPEHLYFVLGAVADKDLETMFGLLPKTNTTYYFCNADIPRAKPAQALAQTAKMAGLFGQSYSSVLEAYQTALAAAQKNPSERAIVYVGGSIFVIGELLSKLGD
jgi:dihydrofolate synthase/folylpolyglutamate synthase